MASDWLAAVLPANQMPGLKIFVNQNAFQLGNVLVTQARDRLPIWNPQFPEAASTSQIDN